MIHWCLMWTIWTALICPVMTMTAQTLPQRKHLRSRLLKWWLTMTLMRCWHKIPLIITRQKKVVQKQMLLTVQQTLMILISMHCWMQIQAQLKSLQRKRKMTRILTRTTFWLNLNRHQRTKKTSRKLISTICSTSISLIRSWAVITAMLMTTCSAKLTVKSMIRIRSWTVSQTISSRKWTNSTRWRTCWATMRMKKTRSLQNQRLHLRLFRILTHSAKTLTKLTLRIWKMPASLLTRFLMTSLQSSRANRTVTRMTPALTMQTTRLPTNCWLNLKLKMMK